MINYVPGHDFTRPKLDYDCSLKRSLVTIAQCQIYLMKVVSVSKDR